MNPLPHPLQGPLHMLPWWLPWIGYGLPTALLYWWLRRRWRARPVTAVPPPIPPLPPVLPAMQDIHGAIESIWQRAADGAYRERLYELSGLIRQYFGWKNPGSSIAGLTGREIKEQLRKEEPAGFFLALEEPLFSAREPGKKELKDLCDRAGEITRSRTKRGTTAQ